LTYILAGRVERNRGRGGRYNRGTGGSNWSEFATVRKTGEKHKRSATGGGAGWGLHWGKKQEGFGQNKNPRRVAKKKTNVGLTRQPSPELNEQRANPKGGFVKGPARRRVLPRKLY